MAGAAFVLTGGRSSRLGRDKALLPYRGTTLVEWIAGQAREAAGAVFLVGAPERYGHLDLPCLAENYPGCGPLSGIETALRVAESEMVLVVACDMPGLESAVLRHLIETAENSGADVTAAALAGGQPEPLCAVYRRSVLPAVQEALARGEYAVHRLLKKLHVILYPIDSEMVIRNINTAEEWARCRP